MALQLRDTSAFAPADAYALPTSSSSPKNYHPSTRRTDERDPTTSKRNTTTPKRSHPHGASCASSSSSTFHVFMPYHFRVAQSTAIPERTVEDAERAGSDASRGQTKYSQSEERDEADNVGGLQHGAWEVAEDGAAGYSHEQSGQPQAGDTEQRLFGPDPLLSPTIGFYGSRASRRRANVQTSTDAQPPSEAMRVCATSDPSSAGEALRPREDGSSVPVGAVVKARGSVSNGVSTGTMTHTTTTRTTRVHQDQLSGSSLMQASPILHDASSAVPTPVDKRQLRRMEMGEGTASSNTTSRNDARASCGDCSSNGVVLDSVFLDTSSMGKAVAQQLRQQLAAGESPRIDTSQGPNRYRHGRSPAPLREKAFQSPPSSPERSTSVVGVSASVVVNYISELELERAQLLDRLRIVERERDAASASQSRLAREVDAAQFELRSLPHPQTVAPVPTPLSDQAMRRALSSAEAVPPTRQITVDGEPARAAAPRKPVEAPQVPHQPVMAAAVDTAQHVSVSEEPEQRCPPQSDAVVTQHSTPSVPSNKALPRTPPPPPPPPHEGSKRRKRTMKNERTQTATNVASDQSATTPPPPHPDPLRSRTADRLHMGGMDMDMGVAAAPEPTNDIGSASSSFGDGGKPQRRVANRVLVSPMPSAADEVLREVQRLQYDIRRIGEKVELTEAIVAQSFGSAAPSNASMVTNAVGGHHYHHRSVSALSVPESTRPFGSTSYTNHYSGTAMHYDHTTTPVRSVSPPGRAWRGEFPYGQVPPPSTHITTDMPTYRHDDWRGADTETVRLYQHAPPIPEVHAAHRSHSYAGSSNIPRRLISPRRDEPSFSSQPSANASWEAVSPAFQAALPLATSRSSRYYRQEEHHASLRSPSSSEVTKLERLAWTQDTSPVPSPQALQLDARRSEPPHRVEVGLQRSTSQDHLHTGATVSPPSSLDSVQSAERTMRPTGGATAADGRPQVDEEFRQWFGSPSRSASNPQFRGEHSLSPPTVDVPTDDGNAWDPRSIRQRIVLGNVTFSPGSDGDEDLAQHPPIDVQPSHRFGINLPPQMHTM